MVSLREVLLHLVLLHLSYVFFLWVLLYYSLFYTGTGLTVTPNPRVLVLRTTSQWGVLVQRSLPYVDTRSSFLSVTVSLPIYSVRFFWIHHVVVVEWCHLVSKCSLKVKLHDQQLDSIFVDHTSVFKLSSL